MSEVRVSHKTMTKNLVETGRKDDLKTNIIIVVLLSLCLPSDNAQPMSIARNETNKQKNKDAKKNDIPHRFGARKASPENCCVISYITSCHGNASIFEAKLAPRPDGVLINPFTTAKKTTL